ncbi:MAG: substrate-binding domain-containing protein [Nitrospirota bacterium]
MKYTVYISAVLAAGLVLAGCSKQEEPRKVDLEKRAAAPKKVEHRGQHLRIAVGGMITPKAGFGYYKQFLDYIGEQIGMGVEFVDRENYAEINELVRNGNADVAFVCGGPYVDGHRAFGMELLAAPQAYGKTVYHSYIIVPKDSPAENFRHLRGKSFAFTDPLSNSGKLAPTYMLARMGETPDSFFKKVIYTRTHDKSIKSVAQKIVDAAAVDSLIWEYENRTNPEFTSKTKIIERSPAYGIPPVVVRKDLAPTLKERLQQVFLNAHEDEKGRVILNGMMIDRFVRIEDSAYNSIREMQDWIARQDQKQRKNR